MSQTDPLNFAAAHPKDLFAKLHYKDLRGPIKADYFSAPEAKNYQQYTTPVPPFTVPNNFNLNDLWSKVWGPKGFFQLYKEHRNETKLDCPDWEFNAERTVATRVIRCIVVVDAPMPDTPTQFVEAHRVAAVQQNGRYELWYQHSAQTPDVISGTSFRVESLIVASADSPTSAPVTLNFTGNVLKCSAAFFAVKFIAVPRAMRETGDAMRQYCKTMVEFIGSDMGSAAGGGGGASAATAGGDAEKAAAAPAAAAPMQPAMAEARAATPPPMAFGGGGGDVGDSGGMLATVLPFAGLVISLGVMGLVCSRSLDTLSRLERSVELQNRRWSFVEQHVAIPFGGLGGLMTSASSRASAGEGASAVMGGGMGMGGGALRYAAPYNHFVGGEGLPTAPAAAAAAAGGANTAAPAAPNTAAANAGAAATAAATNVGEAADVGGNEGRSGHHQHPHSGHHYHHNYNAFDTAIPRWAHVVVGEVSALQSRLASAYWVIGAQLAAMVVYVLRRLLSGGGKSSVPVPVAAVPQHMQQMATPMQQQMLPPFAPSPSQPSSFASNPYQQQQQGYAAASTSLLAASNGMGNSMGLGMAGGQIGGRRASVSTLGGTTGGGGIAASAAGTPLNPSIGFSAGGVPPMVYPPQQQHYSASSAGHHHHGHRHHHHGHHHHVSADSSPSHPAGAQQYLVLGADGGLQPVVLKAPMVPVAVADASVPQPYESRPQTPSVHQYDPSSAIIQQ